MEVPVREFRHNESWAVGGDVSQVSCTDWILRSRSTRVYHVKHQSSQGVRQRFIGSITLDELGGWRIRFGDEWTNAVIPPGWIHRLQASHRTHYKAEECYTVCYTRYFLFVCLSLSLLFTVFIYATRTNCFAAVLRFVTPLMAWSGFSPIFMNSARSVVDSEWS